MWTERAVTLAFVFAIVAALLPGCRGVFGIDDRSVGARADAAAGDESVCPASVRSPTRCTTCLDEACCAPLTDCRRDAACSAVADCLEACTGEIASVTACRIRCKSTLPTSVYDRATTLMACQSQSCSDACALRCGGYVHPSAECESCASSSCCTEAAACAGDQACFALANCSEACAPSDGLCRIACAQDHKAGMEKHETLQACTKDKCAAPCFEAGWACLGKPAAPDPPSPYRLTVTAVDFVTLAPISGVRVSFCADGDGACLEKAASASATDDHGVAQITLDRIRGGCVLFSAPDAGPDIVPTCAVIGLVPEGSFAMSALLFRRTDYAHVFAPAPSPTLATVLAFVNDCAGTPAKGVTLTSTSGVRTAYWRAGHFDDSATETDASGLAALVDLPTTDPRVVRAEVTSSLPAVGQATLALRAGILSYVGLGP